MPRPPVGTIRAAALGTGCTRTSTLLRVHDGMDAARRPEPVPGDSWVILIAMKFPEKWRVEAHGRRCVGAVDDDCRNYPVARGDPQSKNGTKGHPGFPYVPKAGCPDEARHAIQTGGLLSRAAETLVLDQFQCQSHGGSPKPCS